MDNSPNYTKLQQQRRPGDPPQGIKGRRALLLGDDFHSRNTTEVVANAVKREVLRPYQSSKLIHWWQEDRKSFRFRFKLDIALNLSTHDLKDKLRPVMSIHGLTMKTDFLSDPFKYFLQGQRQAKLLRTWMIRFVAFPTQTMSKLRSIFLYRGVNDWKLWDLAPGGMQACGYEMAIPIIWHGSNTVPVITKTLTTVCRNSRVAVKFIPNLSDDFEGTLTFSSPERADHAVRQCNKEGIKYWRTLLGSPRMNYMRKNGLAPENDKQKVDWDEYQEGADWLLD